MRRSLPPLKMKRSPLVLVLCQIGISSIRDMANYIPKVQDRLRRQRFPVDVSSEVVELTLQNEDSAKESRRAHWEFRTLEEDWSIIVSESAVVVQTTAYAGFEKFLEILSLAMTSVDAVVGDLIVERIGLRYVDVIQPQLDESWKDYVKSGYHGEENDLVRSDNSVFFMQTVADTRPGQRLIVRLTQNRDGLLLPPDLVPHHPALQSQAEQGELVTLLDLDHYREARQPFEISGVVDVAWELHDGLDIMFRDLVTTHALEVWG